MVEKRESKLKLKLRGLYFDSRRGVTIGPQVGAKKEGTRDWH